MGGAKWQLQEVISGTIFFDFTSDVFIVPVLRRITWQRCLKRTHLHSHTHTLLEANFLCVLCPVRSCRSADPLRAAASSYRDNKCQSLKVQVHLLQVVYTHRIKPQEVAATEPTIQNITDNQHQGNLEEKTVLKLQKKQELLLQQLGLRVESLEDRLLMNKGLDFVDLLTFPSEPSPSQNIGLCRTESEVLRRS